ncbi:MAG: sulfonate transport system ATP-binding protein [Alphaproteobacteria bacterium]|jgi:NitT/TauT family transport system ATP-binding protein|nr:sulfonate transport system ATP-binding protein [Alphaproteobacteria bacterium]
MAPTAASFASPSTHPALPLGATVAPSRAGNVAFEDVVVRLGRSAQPRLILDRISLAIPSGQFVCVLGPSGCGKSTLLNTLAGFVAVDSGRVTVDGDLVTAPGADRGVVFQDPTLFPWKTVIENVSLGPLLAGRGAAEAERIGRTLLARVGLSARSDNFPKQLSGGMQQRVGIARALANNPRVLLMDEPFGALDAQTRSMMQRVLLDVWAEIGVTVLFITHDIDEAVILADRVLIMGASLGRIIDDVPVPLPRPRADDVMFLPEFNEIKRHCFEHIRRESTHAFAQQQQA